MIMQILIDLVIFEKGRCRFRRSDHRGQARWARLRRTSIKRGWKVAVFEVMAQPGRAVRPCERGSTSGEARVTVDMSVQKFLRRLPVDAQLLAHLVGCHVTDVERALAGKPIPQSLIERVRAFRSSWESRINIYCEGWDVLIKCDKEISEFFYKS